MRLDNIVYGPIGRMTYETNYYYDETSLQLGWILDDNNDSIGFGFQFPKTGTINKVGFYTIEIYGNPDYAFTFATISGQSGTYGEGYPDMNPLTKVGTIYSNAQWQSYDPEVVGSGWNWIDLSTPVNVTKGDLAAFIIVPSGAVTPNSTNKIEVNDESCFSNQSPAEWRYSTYWNANQWQSPAGLKYSDNTILGLCITSPVWYEFASPAEWGVEFQLPVQATCVGAVYIYYPSTSYPNDSPHKIILADSSDTELASYTVTDQDRQGNFSGNWQHISWDTSSDPVLEPNTTYRLYLKPTSAEVVSAAGIQLESESAKTALPCSTDWKWIERTTPASGWTTIANQYPTTLSLLLNELTSTGGDGGQQQSGGGTYGFIG